jgi:hypothetical protein
MPAKPNAFSFRASLRALSPLVQVIQGASECSRLHLRRLWNGLLRAWTFELGESDRLPSVDASVTMGPTHVSPQESVVFVRAGRVAVLCRTEGVTCC